MCVYIYKIYVLVGGFFGINLALSVHPEYLKIICATCERTEGLPMYEV